MEDSSPDTHFFRAAGFGLTALLLLSLLSCGDSSLPLLVHKPEPELRLAVDTHDPILQLPVYVAVARRLFAAERLRISLVEYSDGAQAAEALSKGGCQLASAGFDQVLKTRAQGQDLTAFRLLARSPMLSLIATVRPRKRHRPAPGLDGQSIAITAAGDDTDEFVHYVVGAEGAKHIQTVAAGSSAQAARALVGHDVAAAVLDAATLQTLDPDSMPYAILADTRTLSGLLETYGVSTYPASCVFAGRDWISAHPDQARRISRALAAASRWIRTHRSEEVLPVLPAWYRKRINAAVLATVIEQARPLFSQDGMFTADGAAAVRKLLPAATDQTGAYTNQYLGAAKR